MYVEPTTNIKILHNVPLDTTYDHTLYFQSLEHQLAYFETLIRHNLTNQTYQRVNRGYARVGIPSEQLYDCNYIMFQNTGFGNKWFFAFIKSVEYINNQCSEIQFEIDVMQTWLFDCSPDMCFVDREHTVTDNIGIHIEPEGLDCGEYVYNNYAPLKPELGLMGVGVLLSESAIESENPNEPPQGTVFDGIYSGCELWVFNGEDVDGIRDLLDKFEQKPEAVVSMYTFPVLAYGYSIPAGGTPVTKRSEGFKIPLTGNPITSDETIDGYRPKNKKLYTYPYNYAVIDNASGSSLALRFEFFKDLAISVKIECNIISPVSLVLRPVNYKGSGADTLNTESLKVTNYPMCSWSTDAYKAWVAQNSIPMGIDLVGSSVKGFVGGAMTGGLMMGAFGAGMSTLGTATGILKEGYQASIQADIVRGNVNNGNNNVANGKQQFYYGRVSVTAQYARMIDDYFTVFGYACRRVKIPNRSSRPHWNYVKTVGCTVTGSVPCDDMKKICEIYDRGVTFWKNGNEVGNYGLDNSPQ